jgi:putative membrane protein insertion efficiency factor
LETRSTDNNSTNKPSPWWKQLLVLLSYPFILLIKIYQYIISPVIGPKCRFTPTCSHYAVEALKKHGIFKGGWLTLKRIGRCRPGGGHGYDPVP